MVSRGHVVLKFLEGGASHERIKLQTYINRNSIHPDITVTVSSDSKLATLPIRFKFINRVYFHLRLSLF